MSVCMCVRCAYVCQWSVTCKYIELNRKKRARFFWSVFLLGSRKLFQYLVNNIVICPKYIKLIFVLLTNCVVLCFFFLFDKTIQRLCIFLFCGITCCHLNFQIMIIFYCELELNWQQACRWLMLELFDFFDFFGFWCLSWIYIYKKTNEAHLMV